MEEGREEEGVRGKRTNGVEEGGRGREREERRGRKGGGGREGEEGRGREEDEWCGGGRKNPDQMCCYTWLITHDKEGG